MTSTANPQRLRLAIIEDDFEYAKLLERFCERSPDIEVVLQVGSIKQAIEGFAAHALDLALVDLGLPDGNGITLIEAATQRSLPCLILTVHDDDTHLFDALKAGAVGYLLKEELSFLGLQQAIAEFKQGGAPMSFSIARRVISYFHNQQSPRLKQLTKRETQVLDQLAKGYNARKVADRLNLAYETVRYHQKNIYRKLQVNSAAGAISKLNSN